MTWNWLHGPISDQAIVFGVAVFWWKRLLDSLQLIAGITAVFELIAMRKLRQVHERLVEEVLPFPSSRTTYPDYGPWYSLLVLVIASGFILWMFMASGFMSAALFNALKLDSSHDRIRIVFGLLSGFLMGLLIIHTMLKCEPYDLAFVRNRFARFLIDPRRFRPRLLFVSTGVFALSALFKMVLS